MEAGKEGKSNIKYFSTRGLLLLLFMIIISAWHLQGQTSYKENIYNAFINGQMDLWEYNMIKMEEKYLKESNIQCLYDLTYTLYGYIAYCVLTDDKPKARYYLNKARQNTIAMIEYDSLWAEVYSLRGAFYGFEIGMNPLKTLDYGIKSIKNINRAVKLDKDNARVLMEIGNMKYYTPKILGGGLRKAIYYHEKAISMFESDESELKSNWVYLLVLTNLARWYSEDKRKDEAMIIYEKILKIEPDYLWVKNILYPELLQSYN